MTSMFMCIYICSYICTNVYTHKHAYLCMVIVAVFVKDSLAQFTDPIADVGFFQLVTILGITRPIPKTDHLTGTRDQCLHMHIVYIYIYTCIHIYI